MGSKFKISSDFIINEYNKYKRRAFAYYENKQFEKLFSSIEYISELAVRFPFLRTFTDNDIEDLVKKVSHQLIQKQPMIQTQKENRIVFYNTCLLDNSILTIQYLDAFLSLGYQVLIILPDEKSYKNARYTYGLISKNKNVSIFIAERGKKVEKIVDIHKSILRFEPSHIFIHNFPGDIVSCCCFSAIKHIDKYYIVANDHTFWLGSRLFDYYIEFRQFGISLSENRRQIPLNKILHIPYYPINSKIPFLGFPFDRKDKIVGISGGNLYKYYLDPELNFFYIIKELLLENPNFIFCLCGWGEKTIIENFIKVNKLEERFFYLGKRPDFYELVGNCDILFESYPLKGGLTFLFATNQKIPVTGIATHYNASQGIENWLEIDNYKQPDNLVDFKTEATLLINSAEKRKKQGDLFFNNKYNRTDFEKRIKAIMSRNLSILQQQETRPLLLDDQKYLDEYLKLPHANLSNIYKRKLQIIRFNLSIPEILKSISLYMFYKLIKK